MKSILNRQVHFKKGAISNDLRGSDGTMVIKWTGNITKENEDGTYEITSQNPEKTIIKNVDRSQFKLWLIERHF